MYRVRNVGIVFASALVFVGPNAWSNLTKMYLSHALALLDCGVFVWIDLHFKA